MYHVTDIDLTLNTKQQRQHQVIWGDRHKVVNRCRWYYTQLGLYKIEVMKIV